MVSITRELANETSKSLVHRMISNPIYLGIITAKGETYDGTFEPLIEKRLFDKVQQVLKQNQDL